VLIEGSCPQSSSAKGGLQAPSDLNSAGQTKVLYQSPSAPEQGRPGWSSVAACRQIVSFSFWSEFADLPAIGSSPAGYPSSMLNPQNPWMTRLLFPGDTGC